MDPHEYYGLREPAFTVTPDPRFAYETTEHRLAILHIKYHIDNSRGIFLLHGDIGTGKTTVAKFLMSSVFVNEAQYVVGHLDSPSTRSSAGFLRAVLGAFVAEPPRYMDKIERTLKAFLIDHFLAGRKVVLFLDEAQRLSLPGLDVLHQLCNLQSTDKQLLQIVLVAQPNFQNKLSQNKALTSRIAMGVELSPLVYDDAMAMIQHRLKVAGDESVFDRMFLPESRRAIYDATGGICRDICLLCDSAMMNAYALNRPVIDLEAVGLAVRNMAFKEWECK